MDNEEPETKEECMKIFYRILSKDMIEYWKKYLDVANNEEWGYQVDFVVGVKYALEEIVQPHLDKMHETLCNKSSVQ